MELPEIQSQTVSIFSGIKPFEDAQRIAKLLCQSSLVPKEYQNNLPNTIIAMEIANRAGASPLMIMQNLYVVHGKPAWSSQFIISAVNSCGRFKPLRFDMIGAGDERGCTAWTVEKDIEVLADIRTLEDAKSRNLPTLESPLITISMAKKEGWYGRNGSKWQTMPELMLRYRAASFFGKLYAPEILMGMQTKEEVIDIGEPINITPSRVSSSVAERLAEKQGIISEQAVADILMLTGELLKFPQELDTIKLMKTLQEMSGQEQVQFMNLNIHVWPDIIKYLREDDKPAAAGTLEKLLLRKGE